MISSRVRSVSGPAILGLHSNKKFHGGNVKIKQYACIVFAMALSSAGLFAQVSSTIVGSVVDPADAVISGAPVSLTSADTGAVRTANTDSLGTYRFSNVAPGTYNVTVKATGFKSLTQTGIVVTAEETHNAGKMVLQLGSVSESMSGHC